MDPFDTGQTAAVWARVYGERWNAMSPSTPPHSSPEQPPALPQALAELIAGERQDAVTYYHMARLAGSDAPVLRRIAQEEAGHARKLAALHLLMTQQLPPQTAPTAGLEPLFSQMLAGRYRDELAGAERYRRAAEQYPDHAGLFRMLAEDEDDHARRLLELAERRL